MRRKPRVEFDFMWQISDQILILTAVAANEGGGIRVLMQPTDKIVTGNLQQRRFLPEPGGDAPSHLQADFIVDVVLHGRNISRSVLLPSTTEMSSLQGIWESNVL